MAFSRNIATESFMERSERGKKFGVIVGIVTDNKDPDGKYRVRVRIPSQANGDESGQTSESTFWYRVCTFGAGENRGMYNLPEVNDEVLLAFENGEVSHGYVIGTLWNQKSPVFTDNKKDGENKGENNVRWYQSRTKNWMKFNDKKDETGIQFQTSGGHKVYCDDKKPGQILIQHLSGKTSITLLEKDIKIFSDGDTIMDCDNFKLTAKSAIEMKSGSDTKITSSANIKGQASSNIELKASGEGKFVSSGTMTLQGATVNIN